MSRKILVADDSAFMRSHIKSILQDHGYQDIIEAINGQMAIDLYKHIKPDITLLDLTMPQVDGLTALREIIEFDHSAKVIMCSAMGTEFNIKSAEQLGAKDFIVKPHFADLVNVLEKLETVVN